MQRFLTGVAQQTPSEDLSRAVARQRLLSRLTDHPVAPLTDCVQIGRAVGLSMSEMQRLTGVARQTLYRQIGSDDDDVRQPLRAQATIEVLILLASEREFVSPGELGRRASLRPETVMVAMTDLASEGLAELRRDSYSSLEAAPTEATYQALREQFDDLFLRRPDAISVYVRVPEEHQRRIALVADEALPRHEHVVMPRSTVPSVMVGPELAMAINAPTIRRALVITRDLWEDLLDRAGIPFFEPVIANLILPGSHPLVPSDVLDAFVEALVDAGVPNGDALRDLRSRFNGGVTEVGLAGRCVTVAALVLRRAVGNEREPRPIVNGDSAFAELQPANGVPVGRQVQPVKDATVEALTLATDRLGPFPAGRAASISAPGAPPNIVRSVQPSSSDLTTMARLSGEAVGAGVVVGATNALSALTRVLASGGDN